MTKEFAGPRRNLTLESYKATVSEQENILDRVQTSHYYHYGISEREPSLEEIPHMQFQTINRLYPKAVPAASAFFKSQQRLLITGQSTCEQGMSVPSLVSASKIVLSEGDTLIKGLSVINTTKAEIGKQQLKGIDRILITNYLRELGSEKSDSFRETMRRYIPRWMWIPLPYPEDIVDEKNATTLWNTQNIVDGNLLISPENFADGKRPIHMVFNAADTLERSGEEEVSYALKTKSIISILDKEKELAEQGDDSEIPFFHIVVGGLLTGETGLGVKDAFFDYQSAITKTLEDTFVKFQDEIEEDKTGPATHFLDKLSQHYPEHFPELLAKAVLTHGKKLDSLDEFNFLQSLTKINTELMHDTWEKIISQPERRVLSTDEVEQLSPTSFSPSQETSLEQFMNDVAVLADKGDIYGFTTSIQKLGMRVTDMKTDIGIELDTTSEQIAVQLTCVKGNVVRYIPFVLSVSGEKESLQFQTLGSIVPNDHSLNHYRDVVAKAINAEVNKIKKIEQGTSKSQVVFTERPQLKTALLTREQRMNLYGSQRVSRKRKKSELRPKRGHDRTFIPDPSIDLGAEVQPNMTIVGLTKDNLEAHLTEGGIQVISSASLMKKLVQVIESSQISKKMLGKPVNLDSIGKTAEGINLRQINLVLDGGTNQIRVYLEAVDNGNFVLRGVFLKKGETEQSRYIAQVVRQILQEKEKAT